MGPPCACFDGVFGSSNKTLSDARPLPSSRSVPNMTGQKITLNVGGVRFATTRTTVMLRAGGSVLEEIIAGPLDDDGEYFIDRDGQLFFHILSYLRDGDEFDAPVDSLARSRLSNEAKKLRLGGLVKLLEAGQIRLANGEHEEAVLTNQPLSDNGGAFPQQAALAENLDLLPCPSQPGDVYRGGADLPASEEARLKKLHSLNVLDTGNDRNSDYDNITMLVAALLEVPICLVSLIDKDRQWFKSKVGLEPDETSRQLSFCAFALIPEEKDCAQTLIIEDAHRDPRFAQNPLVLGDPKIRFYAGCPLITSEGHRLGTLCAIDRVPRVLSAQQVQILSNFAQLTVQVLDKKSLTEAKMPDVMRMLENNKDMPLDFTGGPLRLMRMKQALHESVLLVWAKGDSMDWPMVYANEVWAEMTGVIVTPPRKFPGKVQVKLPEGMSGEGRSLWDHLGLKSVDSDQIIHLWKMVRGDTATSGDLLAVSATVMKKPVPGQRPERIDVSCRFMPAEMPLDENAAVVWATGMDRESQHASTNTQPRGWPRGRWYFVIVVPAEHAQPTSHTPLTSTTPTSSTHTTTLGSNSSATKPGGKTMPTRKIVPRTPFEDVKLLRLIGQGSFGSVYFGLWSGAPVAVKTIKSFSSGSVDGNVPAQSFEALLTASISHPYLVQTYKHGERMSSCAEGAPDEVKGPGASNLHETWIVQEWCDGGTLRSRCTVPRIELKDLCDVVEIGIEISRAGTYLHDMGIIHGDLNPNNVLTKKMSTRRGFICKVCDFGLARVLEGGTDEICTQTMGTVTHMPPELFLVQTENCKLTPKADVYAMGLIVYEAITALSPYHGMSAPQIVVNVSRGMRLNLPEQIPEVLQQFYAVCTSRNFADRPTFLEATELLSKAYDAIGDKGDAEFW
mmetsp:Transcript_62096/g.111821  ORF Transcript_62096/g.111821 Transcript_62096/m.111821 type:complete len:900 (+) Transcript_62096:83-2782(+)